LGVLIIHALHCVSLLKEKYPLKSLRKFTHDYCTYHLITTAIIILGVALSIARTQVVLAAGWTTTGSLYQVAI
jgi:hypothetical protein